MFRTFVDPLELEFGVKSNHRVGRFTDVSKSQEYRDRIEAINFSLAHDDGQSSRNLAEADDVILLGVSRSGKTPTSLYLAMQHGIKAANCPLIPEDFERGRMPTPLTPYKRKCFGLTIDPERLSQIRNERGPTASTPRSENCRCEVARGREHDAACRACRGCRPRTTSIEEIATTILRDLRPDRLVVSTARGARAARRSAYRFATGTRAAAAATFSDSSPPGWGMRTVRAQRASKAASTPCPSWPITHAQGCGSGARQLQPRELVATSGHQSAHRAGRLGAIDQRQREMRAHAARAAPSGSTAPPCP
jgi:hypothetical protein